MEAFFKSTLSLLLIMAHLFYISGAASPNSFILTSCKTTSYPGLCAQSLAAYSPFVRRSPRQLAHAALTVSATQAREASAYLTRLSSGTGHNSAVQSQVVVVPGAVQDCVATMSDSVDRLQRSVRQLRKLGRAGRPSYSLRLRNVQAWVSGALTDQSMCLTSLVEGGGIGGSGVKQVAAIRKKVAEVSRVTSNALSLVNRLGYRN